MFKILYSLCDKLSVFTKIMQNNEAFYLFISLETDGVGHFFSQTVIRIAMVVTNVNQEVLSLESFFVRNGATKLVYNPCNYTLEQVNNGVRPRHAAHRVMQYVLQVVQNGGLIVAHNMNFVDQLLLHIGVDLKPFYSFTRCTMREGVNLCQIGTPGKYKYPQLIELSTFLFPESVVNLGFSSAEEKAWAVQKCFFEMKNKYIDVYEKRDNAVC